MKSNLPTSICLIPYLDIHGEMGQYQGKSINLQTLLDITVNKNFGGNKYKLDPSTYSWDRNGRYGWTLTFYCRPYNLPTGVPYRYSIIFPTLEMPIETYYEK
jgi:hypothetical protein